MKGETLHKPPALLLPPVNHRAGARSQQSSSKDKDKSLEERAVHKFTAKYDAFQGILKRVSEMKLSGSLDSEEPSTGSERSESSRSKRRVESASSSADNAFEDESCCSSVTGSDLCPPYEEVLENGRCGGYTCPAYGESGVSSFGEEIFPPAPFPAEFREKKYKTKEETKGHGRAEPRRKSSLGDSEDDRWKSFERRLSSEAEGPPRGISESEKHQLEMFFRSLKTEVFVCGSPANLYFGWKEDVGNWTYKHTGSVVVVFDSADTRCRSKRKIQILLAERGTCFPLWRDTVDNLSAYRKSGSAFHTMYLSCDHRQVVGLSFDSPAEAEKLLRHLEQLTSNPENINISVPGSKKRKSLKKKGVPLPHKKHISNPCLFQHVTSVSAKDKPIYVSLQTLLDGELIKTENFS